jgi:DNA-binding MarR family transcriptional regulator
MKLAPQIVPVSADLTDNLTVELQITYYVAIVANLMAFGNVRANTKRFNINASQWAVLFAIGQAGPSVARKIAEDLGLDKGTVSRAVSELAANGHIRKLLNRHHKRSPFIALTQKGEALYGRVMPVFISQNVMFTRVLRNGEKQQLCDLLSRLRAHIVKVRREKGLD